MEKKGVGVGVTGRMCEVKFANLKATYKSNLARLTSNAESTWTFFDAMAELLDNDPSIDPNNILEAGASGFN